MTVATALAALFLVSGLLFEGPIAHIWYQTRQQNLAVSLAGKRMHDRKGQATAVLQIPKINLDLVVVEGDGPAQLRAGPGHRIGTPSPGSTGNSLIFGHRSGWGGSFSAISKLRPNDNIVVKNRTGQLPFLFQVRSVTRVSAADTGPLAQSTDHRLTLVTSAGGGFSSERLVVVAVSGGQGHLVEGGRRARADSPRGSVLFNATTGLLILLVAASVVIDRQLRRGRRPSFVAAMMAPAVLAALLALLLEVDLLIFPSLR